MNPLHSHKCNLLTGLFCCWLFFPLSPIHIDQLLSLTGLLVEEAVQQRGFQQGSCNGRSGNGFALEESGFRLSRSKDFFTVCVVGHLVLVLHP